MARALTPTKLPLDTWARIMGMHPLHFNQVSLANESPHCNQIMFQHEWQNYDHVSREEIARAIADAETLIEEQLGYHLAPAWEVDEWRGTHRYYRSELVNLNSSDVRGYRQTVQAKWGYFITGGIEAKDLVEEEAPIAYTDPDGDSYFERATVSVSTVAVDPSEIAVYYPGKDGDDAWEIRPIEVSIASGVATITFRRELAVIPEHFDIMDTEDVNVDGLDDANFLETVDVYRHYNDPQTQASFLWEPLAGGWCGSCGGSGCPTCAYNAQTGCLIVRGDPRQSIVGYSPAVWDSDDLNFTNQGWIMSRQPDIVRLYYYSGWRNKRQRYNNRMDPQWERVVARMAAANLDRPPCDCAKGDWSKWREDLTLASGDVDGQAFYRQPDGILDNPFGSCRGQVEAWRKVRQERVLTAVTL